MKVKNKIFSIFLVLTLLISNLTYVSVLADGSDNFSAVARVQQLGILTEGITDINGFITREQLLEGLVVASDMVQKAEALIGTTIYPDIESYSKLSGYVNAVTSKGLMYGMPNGYFHPERGVTYAEACTIMVKLLGYTDSDVTGVWPNNYINKAIELDLTEGLSFKRNNKVTVLAAAVMFNNLLDTNIKKVSASAQDQKFSDFIALYSDYVVLENSITSSSLGSNSVLTDKGTLYFSNPDMKLEVGNKYRLNVEEKNINKVFGQIKETVSITIDSVIENTVYYKDGFVQKSMNMPSEPAYYYHGAKQNYSSLNTVLKPNTTVIFAYSDDKASFEYAIVIDPVYSKPQVAVGFDASLNGLGDISFDLNVPFMKNGQNVSKYEIEELDVVYNVTNISGNNRTIVIFNNRAEGNVKALLPNGIAPTSIQIDNGSYNFSKDMNLSKLSSIKIGDKVSALLGYDGKVVDIVKIDYKTASEVDVRILGNVNTADNLLENQVLTDSGNKYFFLDSVGKLEVGGKYRVVVDGDTIVKIKKKLNSLDIFSVRSVSDITISYGGGETASEMILPRISTYYYHGAKTDYNAVLASLKPTSSIILSKIDGVYEYGVIVDPVYSKPILNNYANKDSIEALDDDKYLFMYRNGSYLNGIGWLEMGDVVYNVTDLWNMNRYIYVSNTKVRGKVAAIQPNKISPKSIQIGNVTYNFSKYFDSSLIYKNDIGTDSYVTLTLDMDGKVIDISK
jgi:hypothetical protein